MHYYSPIEFTHQGLRVLGKEVPLGGSWDGTEPERQAIARDFEKAHAGKRWIEPIRNALIP